MTINDLTDEIYEYWLKADWKLRLHFLYTNWKGETEDRVVNLGQPFTLTYTANVWHPKRQWIFEAWDHERGAVRSFAVEEMNYAKLRVTG